MAKKLRTLSVYRKVIERLPEFRLISPSLTEQLAGSLGFDGMPAEGDSILPASSGPATFFNANGKEIVRRDLPYDAYLRDLIPPPGELITAVRRDDEMIVTSRILRRDESEADIVNLLNIFLELFPTFEIVQPNFAAPVRIQKLNWKILPQGQYPFIRARQVLEEYFQKLNENDSAIAMDRIRTITRYNPDFVAVGIGGFSDYVVFGFTQNRRFVFESPNTGNATYVFRDEWEPISQLSKREILQGNLREERLIHNVRWTRALGELINRP